MREVREKRLGRSFSLTRSIFLSGGAEPADSRLLWPDSAQIEVQMLALREASSTNQKTFFLSGAQHSVIGEGAVTVASDGSSLLPWILQYATDDPEWDHAGP